MTYYEKLEENLNNKDDLTNILLQFDSMLEYLHNQGFCIYDFDPKKIVLDNGKFTPQSFENVINDIGVYKNMKEINIYQSAKIGLMAYNNNLTDGKMNQEHFDFIRNNLDQFNMKGKIPEEIFEYYQELFNNLKTVYMNDYLLQKKQAEAGNQNTNVLRKSLSTPIGRAYVNNDEKAFVNILFIPALLTFIYLVGLLIYVFIFK